MDKRSFTLTDFEDRALAACDDMYLETTIAQNILSSWYRRDIPFAELRRVYSKLFEFGLLRTYTRRAGRIIATNIRGRRTQDLLVRATSKGRTYLHRKPRNVA